jgi:hypothetical protein
VYGLRGQRKAWRVKGRASVTRAAAAADSYSRTVPLVISEEVLTPRRNGKSLVTSKRGPSACPL